MLNKLSKSSPFFLIIFWSLLLLANFIPSIPQPDVIIGYLWKIEFVFATLIVATLLVALRFPKEKFGRIKFSEREIYLIIAPVILFTVWSGLSIVWAASWRNALHHTLLWACYALFYVLVRQIVDRPRLLDASLKIAGIVFAILGIACVVEYLSSAENSVLFTYRYYKYAEAAAMFLPLYLALCLRLKSSAAFVSGAVALLIWLLVVLSYSRTEFVAGVFCLSFFLLLVAVSKQLKENWKKLTALVFVLLISALITQTSLFKSDENLTDRFISGERSQSNLQWRFLIWGISFESFKRKPFQGVGADNFAVDYRASQENYAQRDSNNKLLELDQHIVAERSHNEYVQILAELGAVGAAIFGWLLVGIGTILFSVRRKKASLLSLGALAGIFAFLLSSLASSFSFRVPANGVCFFFLLAVAAGELLKREKSEEQSERETNVKALHLKPILVGGGLLVGGAMLIFSAARGGSLMYLQMALDNTDEAASEENYQKALALDSRDAMLRYFYGLHLYDTKRADEAVPHIRFAINNGISTSLNYFNLATAQTLANQNSEAEKTYAEALRVFPRSIFLLTARASFLKENGRVQEAEVEHQKALQIDSRQAASWQIAHDEGTEKLTKTEGYDKELLPPMELKPLDGIYSLVNFHLQKNPRLAKRDF